MPEQIDIFPKDVEEGASIGEPAAGSLAAGRLVMTVQSKRSGEHITVVRQLPP